MRNAFILAAIGLCLTGCQTTVLRNRTLMQASTVTDYYYLQVLNNIAQQKVNSSALPYFTDPKTQQTTVQRQFQASYTPGWDFISSGLFIGRYLFDKQSAQIQGSENTAQGWQAATTDNPDKILMMRAAYHRAIGEPTEEDETLIRSYYAQFQPSTRYKDSLATGWFCYSTRKRDVPKNACYVGCCRGSCETVYVWVPDEYFEQFSKFTLAILDIATIAAKDAVQIPNKERVEPLMSPRENYYLPFTLQNPPPGN